jgi:hypothetical protein
MNQVVDSERLEQEHHIAQVRALNLGCRVLIQLIRKRGSGVQTKALAGSDTSRASTALIGRL